MTYIIIYSFMYLSLIIYDWSNEVASKTITSRGITFDRKQKFFFRLKLYCNMHDECKYWSDLFGKVIQKCYHTYMKIYISCRKLFLQSSRWKLGYVMLKLKWYMMSNCLVLTTVLFVMFYFNIEREIKMATQTQYK